MSRPLSTAVCALLFVGGCVLDNQGADPPQGQIRFPVSIALDEAERTLFVANANFDLSYNSGTLQSFDLTSIAAGVTACAGDGDCVVDSNSTLVNEVLVGSFASGMQIDPAGERIFLAVRSEANLTVVDIAPGGGLACGGDPGERHACEDARRRGDESIANARGVELPEDPVAVHVGPLTDFGRTADAGDYAVVAHRAGSMSFFLDRSLGEDDRPALVHVLTGLPDELTDVTFDPHRQRFWAPSSIGSRFGRAGVAIDDRTSDLGRSFLFNAGNAEIGGLDQGRSNRADMRAIAFHPTDPNIIYGVSRRPNSVLVMDRANDERVTGIIEVGAGASRIHPEVINGRVLLFVSCFDDRTVYIVEPQLRQVLGIVRGLSGPFELAVVQSQGWLLVADFRASTVRIVDLSPTLSCLDGTRTGECAPNLIATLGSPEVVEQLQ